MILRRPIRIVIVDDHKVFVEALRAALAAHPATLAVVGEAHDARSACSVVQETRPDVVLLDLLLPGADGTSVARELRAQAPQLRILVLSGFSQADRIARAFNAGVDGFALKVQTTREIIDAIETVAEGMRYLPPGLDADGESLSSEPMSKLSPREREIFDLIARGFSNTRIAEELGISGKTVETHRGHINKKLDLHSSADLVRFAARHGLLVDPSRDAA